MDKTEFMVAGTIVKLCLGIIAMIVTLTFLFVGLYKKDGRKKKQAASIFFGTCLALILLSIVEFVILANW